MWEVRERAPGAGSPARREFSAKSGGGVDVEGVSDVRVNLLTARYGGRRELQMFVGRGRARIDAARAAADAAPVEAVAAGSDMQAGGLGPMTAEDGEGEAESGIEGQYGVVGGLDLDALMAEINSMVVAGAAGGFAGRSFVWNAVSECRTY